jgi:hypothetical protein
MHNSSSRARVLAGEHETVRRLYRLEGLQLRHQRARRSVKPCSRIRAPTSGRLFAAPTAFSQ